jgi:amino acid transporter
VIAAGVLGLLLLIALTVSIRNIGQISRSGEAVAQILDDQLGPLVGRMLLVAITFAFFACGMVVLATGSRLIYAMSRDGRFPCHRVLRQVNARTQTPIAATILIFAGGVLLMIVMPGKALLALITAGTILPVLIYAATVVLYLSVRKRLVRKEGAFDLGRFELPVAITALVWLLGATFVLVTPPEAFVPVLIVLGLMLVGGLYFVGMLVFDRKSLVPAPEAIATATP